MKLFNQLCNKHGENVEEKSLTICSGTDYININMQHVVCPDAATAKVSPEGEGEAHLYSKQLVAFRNFIPLACGSELRNRVGRSTHNSFMSQVRE